MFRKRNTRERFTWESFTAAKDAEDWKAVLRRKLYGLDRRFRHREGNVFTIFIEDLPDSFTPIDFHRMFDKFGVVKDVFIPRKRSKMGRQFGFVRYDCSVAAYVAIQKTNGVWIQDKELKVKYADFGAANRKYGSGYLAGRRDDVGLNRIKPRKWVPITTSKAIIDTGKAKEVLIPTKHRGQIATPPVNTTSARTFVDAVKQGSDRRFSQPGGGNEGSTSGSGEDNEASFIAESNFEDLENIDNDLTLRSLGEVEMRGWGLEENLARNENSLALIPRMTAECGDAVGHKEACGGVQEGLVGPVDQSCFSKGTVDQTSIPDGLVAQQAIFRETIFDPDGIDLEVLLSPGDTVEYPFAEKTGEDLDGQIGRVLVPTDDEIAGTRDGSEGRRHLSRDRAGDSRESVRYEHAGRGSEIEAQIH
ncbi:Serine arginine-rich splicing factor 2 [Dionaea muscipula]